MSDHTPEIEIQLKDSEIESLKRTIDTQKHILGKHQKELYLYRKYCSGINRKAIPKMVEALETIQFLTENPDNEDEPHWRKTYERIARKCSEVLKLAKEKRQ